MTDSTKASTILHIYRDVGYLFSIVNLSTALNQFAKATSAEVRCFLQGSTLSLVQASQWHELMCRG